MPPSSIALPRRYDRVAQALHWSMAVLIVLVFALGLLVDAFPSSWEYAVVETHKVVGSGILVLAAARLAWRWTHRPPLPERFDPVLDKVSAIGHLGLYLLMIAVPVIGLAYAALRGQGIDFGLFSIGPVMEADRTLARPVRELHELAAYAIIGLAGIHGLAALWHHYVRKDGVLLRMLPAK